MPGPLHPDHPPFLWGTQYYRAPSPEPECWQVDLCRMKELGFNSVKFWVQWRWSHRGEERYYFEDLDHLMDLAGAAGLGVTLNLILDVAPLWLYRKYPDARQVMASGTTILQYASGDRQIGGTPGPCYNHPGALGHRQAFVAAAVDHFKHHPALAMWDVWSEPEQSFPSRSLNPGTMVCYCHHCRDRFIDWLRRHYSSRDQLNGVWGRCYEEWYDIEVPRNGDTVADFIDWREFHLDTMAAEAAWRLDVVRQRDPAHTHYLHVVPNTMEPFNAVSCVDDFELAPHCQVFAATLNGQPAAITQAISAARGKMCYNAESHLNHGSASGHQPMLNLKDLLADFLPQIGLGIKGFMFWQYRPEVLGVEAPGWGLVKPDGSDRPITTAARQFWTALSPHAPSLMRASARLAQIGIWRSRKNEVFHYAVHGNLQCMAEGVGGYIQSLYWNSYPFRIVSGQMLEAKGLEDLKLLIMPSCYYLTEREARALDEWVRGGGVLLNEAHLGGYNGTTGRHSRIVPGCSLAEAWNIREVDSTAPQHLVSAMQDALAGGVPDDLGIALKDSLAGGGQFLPIRLSDGLIAWGADRYAILDGADLTREGTFDGISPCLVSRNIGEGAVFYCGTNLGRGARKDPAGLLHILRKAIIRAGLRPTLGAEAAAGAVHVDLLEEKSDPRFIVIINRTPQEQTLRLRGPAGAWKGLFTGQQWTPEDGQPIALVPGFVDLLTRV